MGTSAILILVVLTFLVGALVAWLVTNRLSGAGRSSEPTVVRVETIAERVRAVGKLVGLEVAAKEIATATRGCTWLPPLLLSQARLAMIFTFEKQYAVDLARVRAEHVEKLGEGRFRLTLPPVQGDLRLTDVTPYDIQDGRILGLLDVVQMNATRQGELMDKARDQAAILYEVNEPRYMSEARAAIERQLAALLALFDVEVETCFADDLPSRDKTDRLTSSHPSTTQGAGS
ncbi:MAG: DUF4230 domain-containing protein [Phycisphaerales bacterium]|nr:MAG: DUF4230 domain-containing protein [Phycisphaerales bacterium]